MSQYSLFAIGNAIVDMNAHVTDAQLQDWGLTKGGMELVSPEKLESIRSQVEIIHRASGGSAANTVVGVAQAGLEAYYCCRVANDDWGVFYLRDLDAQRVYTPSDEDVLKREEFNGDVTGQCLVLITPDAQRTMLTVLGISNQLSEDDVDPTAISSAKCVYVEGYLLAEERAKIAIEKAVKIQRDTGNLLAVTCSDPWVVSSFREDFDRLFAKSNGEVGIDILFANEDEALAFTGETDADAAAKALKKVAKLPIVTLSEKGAIWVDDSGEISRCPGLPTQAIDTTGAGDAFAAGFLARYLKDEDIAAAVAQGCRWGSDVVAKLGPRLDTIPK